MDSHSDWRDKIMPKLKIALFVALLTGVPVGCWVFGVASGRLSVILKFNNQLKDLDAARTLGSLLESDQRQRAASAYKDPEFALRNMQQFSWQVPSTFTPFVGSAPKPGIHDNATINAWQFRDDRDLVIPKPEGIFRVFLTGGSTAFGSGAPDRDRTIGGYLENRLNRTLGRRTGLDYEVMILAHPGWASTHERIIIVNRLSEWEPDLVISLSGNNDVHWAASVRHPTSQVGEKPKPAIGRNVLWFRSFADENYFYLLNTAFATAGWPPPNDVTQDAETYPRQVAQRLIKNVRISAFALSLANVPYVYFLQPTLSLTHKPQSARESEFLNEVKVQWFERCYGRIDGALRGIEMQNFYYYNLTTCMDGYTAQDEIFLDNYHFGDRGNEILAEQMLGHLIPVVSALD